MKKAAHESWAVKCLNDGDPFIGCLHSTKKEAREDASQANEINDHNPRFKYSVVRVKIREL